MPVRHSRIILFSAAALLFPTASFLSAQEDAAPPNLSDPEIAHVAVTANTIDVEMAEIAIERSSNEDVRAFARTMIADHTGVNEQAGALAGRLGVTPASNAVSRSLREGAASARRGLLNLTGTSFDRAYMDREVAYHEAVLGALDDLLIPSSANEELRDLLVRVRPAIAAHLERAVEIQTALGDGR